MYQAPMSLKEIIVNRPQNYFFLNIMQHPWATLLYFVPLKNGNCLKYL